MKTKLRLFLPLLLTFISLQAVSQTVFINELHYDNDGTDVGEAFEIAGPAGTDLSGFSVVLYNGANGLLYNTLNLSGIIPDQQNGYGTIAVSLPANGLQNGAPDGLALVDASNTVLQFLTYEGSFVAADGPAVGMQGENIGVEEGSLTPAGFSLQLGGQGTEYSQFAWESEAQNTFGNVNTNQTFGQAALSVLINEFVFNHTGTDTSEYVEVLSLPGADLSEYWLLEIEGDGTGAGTIDEVIQLTSADANGYWTTGFLSNAFENGTVTLLLVKNFTGSLGADLDTNDDGIPDVTPWDEIADAVAVFDGGAGDLTYAAETLNPDFDGGSFAVGGASRIPNGINTGSVSDWKRNDFDGAGLPGFTGTEDSGEALNTPGSENQPVNVVVPTTLVINEIDSDTEGTDILEFVELFDGGAGNTPLDGYVLVFYNGSNDQSYAAYDLSGYTTSNTGYFVLGNAGVPGASIVFASNGLQNGADAVALYKGTAADFPNGTVVTTANLEDAVVYDTDDADDAELLVLLNAGQSQLNENGQGNKDFHSLQRYPNGSGGLRNTDSYVQAIPTPGAANTNATEQVALMINEVDADTPGTDTAEFVELYDGGAGNTSLSGFVLVFFNGNGDTAYSAFSLDGYTTNAQGYFVVGNAAVPNVSLVFGDNFLQNGADAVALYQGSAADFPTGTPITTTNLIDAVVYDTDDSDDLELLTLLNPGQPQLNENETGNKDTYSLQRIPNGQGGLRNTATYTQAAPTPGTENGAVVEPQEPITILEARNASSGTTVTVTGVLTATDHFRGSAYLQDKTGAIAVFDELVHGNGVFAIGDSITITGVRSAFNDQIQISPVQAVQSFGPAIEPIEPQTITLAELSLHPAELVRIENVTFPQPGNLLFGNSNFLVSDGSGQGEIRIDADVDGLVGKAQPELCEEVIGVVGRYFELYQLLPRQATDMACAEAYVPPGNSIPVAKEDSFDVVAWNIEWFGDEGNSPASGNPLSDAIQRDSVAKVLKKLDADVYAVEEISDDALFAELVALMPGYSFVLSNATSYPDGVPPFQKVGFIYKDETVTPKETKPLLTTLHPYYNGGDTSKLPGYPAEADRFYASGRMPFLMKADVTINGVTEEIDMIVLHARANSGTDALERYQMRKYDVEVLKDTLDVQFANSKFILLGDYNDDVDETVADINTTVSSYQAYTADTEHYNIVTSSLSAANFRSYVFSENMIDHITISDELNDNYIENSASVHYEFYDSDYTSTASDHFPVSARLLLSTLQSEVTNVTNVNCNGTATGSATVSVTGGAMPYQYLWSDGQTTATAVDLPAGDYTVTVTDVLMKTTVSAVSISEPDAMMVLITEDAVVYPGYEPLACTTIEVNDIMGGTGSYTYLWSNGDAGTSTTVCEPGTYSLTVTDVNGCSVTVSTDVIGEDVSCGNNGWTTKVAVCFKGKQLCISEHAVPAMLRLGAVLGSCENAYPDGLLTSFVIYPNPVLDQTNFHISSTHAAQVELKVYNFSGQQVSESMAFVEQGENNIPIDLSGLPQGFYYVKAGINGKVHKTRILLKR